MIPAKFDYVRASSADEAVQLLQQHGEDAKLLAGGHSLIPLMRLRLATPAVLIDLGPAAKELSFVRDAGDHVAIGGLTRHRDIETSDVVPPLLAHVAGQVGDPQVRHRGTIGGSIAHGDPASDLPAALIALGATLVARGSDGEKTFGVDDFFKGFLETALGPTDVLTEIRVPKASGGWSFQKFNRRAQDWAIVGVALQRSNGGAAVGLVNMGSTPLRARAVEEAIASGASAEDAAAVADQGAEPPADLNASVEFRQHLVRVLTRRALEEAQ